jgi:hypothetical protein
MQRHTQCRPTDCVTVMDFGADLYEIQISASIWKGACKRVVPFAESILEAEITKRVEYDFVSVLMSYNNNIPITAYVKRALHTCVERKVSLQFYNNLPSKFTRSCEGATDCHVVT